MDQRERKEQHPSLPPDYVSLAQLQERWLQKQREKEMREKEAEEEKRQRAAGLNDNPKQRGLSKNNWRVRKAGVGLRREVGENGRQRRGAVEGKGKGEEIVVGGFENSEENKKNEKKKKKKNKGNRHSRKQKYDGEGSDIDKGKLKSKANKEFDSGDGSEESKIVISNEAKAGIKVVLSEESSGDGGMHDGLRGSGEEIVNRVDFRGGFSRNGNNWGCVHKSRRGNRIRLYQLKETRQVDSDLVKKMEVSKGYNSRNWRERRINDNDLNREVYYRLKENGADVLKGNVVEMKFEKKVDENLGVHSQVGCLSGRDNKREGLNDDNMFAQAKMVDEEVLATASVKIGEKGVVVGNGCRRYGHWRANSGRRFGCGLAFNDWNARVGDHMRYARPGSFEGRWKAKKREESGMMWVKKEDKVGSSGFSKDRE